MMHVNTSIHENYDVCGKVIIHVLRCILQGINTCITMYVNTLIHALRCMLRYQYMHYDICAKVLIHVREIVQVAFDFEVDSSETRIRLT